MSMDRELHFRGNNILISEALLKNVDSQLELSWKIFFENTFYSMTFYDVSRLSIREVSLPLEIHGFEIINHSQHGWEKESTYEIRDFEDDRISFFCQHFTIDE